MNITSMRQEIVKLKYELGVTKHKLREAEAKLDSVQVHVEAVPAPTPAVETIKTVECWPISYFSPFGLKGKAKHYGLDHSLPMPKLKEAIASYEKAQGYLPIKG